MVILAGAICSSVWTAFKAYTEEERSMAIFLASVLSVPEILFLGAWISMLN
jgi:hypothetical protein